MSAIENEALRRFLGRALDLPPSAIRIVSGAAARDKVVAVSGLDAASVRARLESPPAAR